MNVKGERMCVFLLLLLLKLERLFLHFSNYKLNVIV